ncbi:MAG: ATP-dependent zinc metalloprotease FtsH [Phycisphaerae bacterium]
MLVSGKADFEMPNQEDPQSKPPRGPAGPPRPPFRMSRGLFSWVMIFGLALMLLLLLNRTMSRPTEISITAFWTELKGDNIKEIVIKENELIQGTYRRPPPTDARRGVSSDKFEVRYPHVAQDINTFQKDVEKEVATRQLERIDIKDDRSNNMLLTILIQIAPWLLIIFLAYFLVFRQLRQTGAGAGMLGSFGRSRHRVTTKELSQITFADVAGIDEAKEEVYEIVEFLKNPKRFARLGGRIPRGVLLVGEPGCGKTMLAKAIAGEADVPFFSISGSDFVEMFVGVGASRVRDLFRQAKENSPCIVFLDEIDAVGRRRGLGYNGGGHDEREQTLNAILVEMDGFDSNDQVIVIAATNRADVLDPALVRPGRFDRQVFVPLPDVKGRFEILKVHAKKIKLSPPIEPKLHRLARATPMFSGADLAAIINEAALLATMAGKDGVELDDLEEARDKIRWGRARRSRAIDERERTLTAYHEAGHAVAQCLLKDADPVHKVSIIPRGPFGGVTFSLPEKDRMTVSRAYVESTLRVLCAGRIAEESIGQDTNSGAAADIKQATDFARRMVTEWGMSDQLGFVYYGEDPQQRVIEFMPNSERSDEVARLIDGEIKRIIDAAYADTRRLLNENREKLEGVAQALLKYETLDGDEVRRIMAGEKLDKPTVADLISAEQERRQPVAVVARPVQQPPADEAGPLPSPA